MLEFWGQLVDAICRPPRDSDYTKADLIGGVQGKFKVSGFYGQRDDCTLENKKGQKLECSHFIPSNAKGRDGKLPCVIYCHCNSGSRRDAEEAVYILIPLGVSVFTLDFAGSGLSDGQYVTLGANEVQDVEVVVNHLRACGKVSTLGLWGRSMGAVTALLYSNRDPSIAGIVVDSPFSRLTDLMLEVVEQQKLPVPRPLLKMALSAMKRSVRKKAGFEIEKVAPIDIVSESFIPALFAHATEDTFIRFVHSEKIHAAYAGDKNLIKFEGDHNSRRPKFFYSSVSVFFHNTLQSAAASKSYPSICRQLDRVLEGGNILERELMRALGDAEPVMAPEEAASQASMSRKGVFARSTLDDWGATARAGLSITGDRPVEAWDPLAGSEEEDPELLVAIQMSLMEAAERQEGRGGAQARGMPSTAAPTAFMASTESAAAPLSSRFNRGSMRTPSQQAKVHARPTSANEEEAMLRQAIMLSLGSQEAPVASSAQERLCSNKGIDGELPGAAAVGAAPEAASRATGLTAAATVDLLCSELAQAFHPVPLEPRQRSDDKLG